MTSSDTILKVDCDGDIRRALLKGIPSYADIDHAVQEIWPGCTADGATYTHEKRGACALKEETFQDFLVTMTQVAHGNLLRLTLLPVVASPAAAEDKAVPSATQAFSRPWEHVRHGSDSEAGTEDLHTVVDLTDVHEQEEVGSTEQVDDIAAGTDDSAAGTADSAAGTASEAILLPALSSSDAIQDDVEATRSRAVSYDIHTPKNSPREGGEALPQDVVPEESSESLAGLPASCFVPRSEDSERTPGGYANHSEPTCGGASSGPSAVPVAAADEGAVPCIIDHDVEEQIDIVLAAFDENGDGHLNFSECNALHHAAWGGKLSIEAFHQMCADEGEDPEVGLGREALMCTYSRCRSLEKDFEAAKAKLEEGNSDASQNRRREAAAHPINLMLKNPLLAVPFALDATERLRQGVVKGVASTLTRKR
jgi:hypothetical protein